MNWLLDNWYIVLGIGALIFTIGLSVYRFSGLPTKEQIIKIKQWLLLAVTEAEAVLGRETGQLKLRYVYDLFISKFPIAARVISFETFELWVDEVLEEMRHLLNTNNAIKSIVESED